MGERAIYGPQKWEPRSQEAAVKSMTFGADAWIIEGASQAAFTLAASWEQFPGDDSHSKPEKKGQGKGNKSDLNLGESELRV